MTALWSSALLVVSALWLLGAVVPIWRRGTTLSLVLALVASVAAAGCGGAAWLGWVTWEPITLPWDLWRSLDEGLLPPLRLTFGLDALGGFFVFLVAAFSALVAIYSWRALQAEHYRPYAHWIASAFNLFSWTTVLTIAAQDGFSLVIALELMSLSFGSLTLYKHFRYEDEPGHATDEVRRKARLAPQVYMMISHASTAFLIPAVLLLAIAAGGWSYQAWQDNASALKGMLHTVIFVLALAGLGIRAGLTPTHVWASLVHPASPTTTHALSLGIAIKVAIYLMYRFFFQFLTPEAWWGYVLLTVAVATALVNVWYAIASHDLKEALAYHSIENIGIICAGVGLALIFWQDQRLLASLSLVASLYHLVNHAVFKGLLYLATGAIDNLTHGTVDIEHLGGLIHRYRFTAGMFLIGSFAIAGFPPLNGFISEWLTLQAGLRSLGSLADAASGAVPIFLFVLALLSLLLLVLSFALTAFCFYKMAGVALLGQPRTPEKERQHWEAEDVPTSMKGVMGTMAILCLLLGILPGLVVPRLVQALAPLNVAKGGLVVGLWPLPRTDTILGQQAGEEDSFAADLKLPVTLSAVQGDRLITDLAINSVVAERFMLLRIEGEQPNNVPTPPMTKLVILFTLLGMISVALQRLFSPRPQRPAIPWHCGELPAQPPVHQYTSSALSYSLRRLLAPFNPRMSSAAPDFLPARFVLSRSDIYPQEVVEAFRLTYNWLIEGLRTRSRKFGEAVQNGDIRRYLRYVFWVNLFTLLLYWITSLLLK